MTVVESTNRPQKSAAAFRTISEVATDLDVLPHVLRFWESKFPQIKPLKRGGGRRYYRPEDVDLLRRIRELLYRDGYTIKGVQKLLRAPHIKSKLDEAAPTDEDRPTEFEQESDGIAMAKEPPSAAMPVALPLTGVSSPPPAPPVVTMNDPRVPTLALAVAASTVLLDGDARAVLDDIVAELEEVRAMLLASARDAQK